MRTILGLAPVDLDVERRFGPTTYTEEQVKAYHAALSLTGDGGSPGMTADTHPLNPSETNHG